MKKSISFIIIFVFLFSFVNVKSVNTIDSVVLMYEKNNIFEENYFDLTFFSFNVKEIPQKFKDLEVEIISVKPVSDLFDSNILTSRGNTFEEITSNLIKKYSSTIMEKGYDEQALYYEQQGFNIESMRVKCLVKDLIILERRINIV